MLTETQKFIDQINREVDPTLARWIANRVKQGIPLEDIKQRIRNAMTHVGSPPATVGSPEEGPVVSVLTEVRVPWETIINAFIGVCETSACTYWMQSFLPSDESSGLFMSCRENGDIWYASVDFWGKGGKAKLFHDDRDDGETEVTTVIGEAEIISGLNRMANVCPRHFADLLSENDDAITHDVMIQCIVFGEIIFG